MEKLFLLMVVFATCHAATQDLSGKVFVFSKEGNRDHVKLLTSKTRLESLTTCLRFQTDLARNYALFSLATAEHSNAFLLYKPNLKDVLRMHARNDLAHFLSVPLTPNTWHSLCSTWDSGTGLGQLWIDGKATIKRYIHTGPITGPPTTILGQEQDSVGGTFDAKQSFIGMITKVHVWDSVIPAAEIKRYMDGKYFIPGNVFNWGALGFQITGAVLVAAEAEVM